MKARKVNDVAILAPHGWLMGGEETDQFEAAIMSTFEEGNRHLILDLGDVNMMNSTAIGRLTACRERYVRDGGVIVLCNVDKRISHILVVTKLSLLFDTYESERQALAAFTVGT